MILYTNQAQHDHAVKSRGGIVGKKQGGGRGKKAREKKKKREMKTSMSVLRPTIGY